MAWLTTLSAHLLSGVGWQGMHCCGPILFAANLSKSDVQYANLGIGGATMTSVAPHWRSGLACKTQWLA
eukprot:876459-Pelagomonas_calceolata.AAC.1